MIRRGPGLLRVAATTAVVAGTATAVSGGMRNRQEQKAQAQQAQAQAAAAPAPAAPAAGQMTDEIISQLKQLAELKNQGILTEEEFATQKAKLLGE